MQSKKEEENNDEAELPIITLSQAEVENSWYAEYLEEEGVYIVKGKKIEKFARRTNFNNIHGVNRLRDIMRKMGIEQEIRRMGGVNESIIEIENNRFELVDSSWED